MASKKKKRKVSKAKPKKSRRFKIVVESFALQIRYVKANSARHAQDMFEGEVEGFDEAEYDYDECPGNDKVISVTEVE